MRTMKRTMGCEIELTIYARKDMSVIESFLTDKQQFQSCAHYSNGVNEWQWHETLEEAEAWCDKFRGLDLCEYITNILKVATVDTDPMKISDNWRAFGALECALMVAGANIPKPGINFEFQEIEVEQRGLFRVTHKRRKETYREHVVRLAKEWLASKLTT